MVVHMDHTYSGPDYRVGADELGPSGLLAETLLASRRIRDSIFAGHIDGFGEPAWDTLLLLFAELAKGRIMIPTDELLAATTTAEEIARPYIAWLASHDLVKRLDDAVALTERGRGLMSAYLEHERAANELRNG